MPAIIDKIADALHLHRHHKEAESAPESSAPVTALQSSTEETGIVKAQSLAVESKRPVFDNEKVTVIFVLGGPGAGKGTQCANLVKDFGFCHLSAGDLLRAEQNREGSQYGEMIRQYIREGQIVPMEVTVKLLENAMRATLAENHEGDGWADGKGRFLIDGFPRKLDQAAKFDQEVCLSTCVLFFTTTEEEMSKRLLERGKTSGREDDNEESIKKRFLVYKEQTMPVIEHYSKEEKVETIDASVSIEEVHETARGVVEKLFANK
ncbi:UMP-CMP kinase [Grifola frondosa]|uniref:Uridylate kinase n=1 Tax=Grifola frondosa TaxID=5627 RepID=A0A1C7MGK2_GRIFR|nr:UMP-CMP kinase [Grifola frondosa]